MELNTALQKLKEYERRGFALYHASGLMYYDGATIAPKGSAGIRAITLGELSRMSYELTTAKESIEMLECLMAHSDELDPVTRRKASELYRDYERTHRVPIEEFVAHQQLCSEADSVWHEAKVKDDFSMFEPYLQKMFDSTKRMALYMEPDKRPYDTMLDNFERGLTASACDAFFDTLKKRLVPLMHKVVEHGDEAVPVALQVVQAYSLRVVADGGGGHHGEHLVERANAARQGYEHVGARHHQLLAVGEVGAWYVYIHVGARVAPLLDAHRHHSRDPRAGAARGPSHTLHEPHVGAAEHQRVAPLANDSPQLFGGTVEVGVEPGVCRAENTNLHSAAKVTILVMAAK